MINPSTQMKKVPKNFQRWSFKEQSVPHEITSIIPKGMRQCSCGNVGLTAIQHSIAECSLQLYRKLQRLSSSDWPHTHGDLQTEDRSDNC